MVLRHSSFPSVDLLDSILEIARRAVREFRKSRGKGLVGHAGKTALARLLEGADPRIRECPKEKHYH